MDNDTCSVAGCDRPQWRRGMCSPHRQRARKGKPLDTPPIREPRGPVCGAQGCARKHHAQGYCEMHYERLRNHGNLDKPPTLGLDRSPFWVGDAACYNTVHRRIRKQRGSASGYECSTCFSEALDWAYDHRDPREMRDDATGMPYSTDPAHYVPMCRKCHIAFDRGAFELVR